MRKNAWALPAVCDLSVTNLCNAACDFCGFARDKGLVGPTRYIDAGAYERALPILHRRGVRYVTLQGGEPLVHPDIVRLVALTAAAGILCTVITNGWFLPRSIDGMVRAGLERLVVSIDSATLAEHERNRGLEGLKERIVEGIARARAAGLPVHASVTVSRLVRYEALPETLRRLGFDAVEFSYPRREPFASSSLVYGDRSHLVDLDRDELLAALDAIGRLKKRFPVLNPRASLAEIARYLNGEPQAVPCVGGYKYFYLDWNLDIWRCEAWAEPLGSVFDLDDIPDRRDPCNACMMACYRNASMLMHAGVAAVDAARAAKAGDLRGAGAALLRRGVALSLRALAEEMPQMRRLARRRRRGAGEGRRSRGSGAAQARAGAAAAAARTTTARHDTGALPCTPLEREIRSMSEPKHVGTNLQAAESDKTLLQKLLDVVETVGNKVPNPAVIFFILAGLVILLSHVLWLFGTKVSYEVVNPQTHQVEHATATVNSLLTGSGARFMLTSMVQKFMSFGPVGIILVVMVGVGVAEQAGLMGALIKKIVQVTPKSAVTWILVTLGVLSSVASDAGYLVLIPLGAGAFLSLGRHPLAGLAAAFSGVAAVFGVNFLIVPIDGILTEITNDSIHLLDPTRNIALTANFYFAVVSSLVLIVVCTLVSERIVEPRLGQYVGEVPEDSKAGLSAEEARGLRLALYALVASAAAIALLTFPAGAPLRNQETGAILGNSPFMSSLIVLIMLVFLAVGVAYGVGAKTITSMEAGINAVTKTFAGLSGLIFLLFVISQFLAYFDYSNIATIVAVDLGDALEHANLGTVPLMLGFVTVTGLVGMLIVGAIPKWALLAPIFVPLFMKLGVAPEAVLAAYRVGDSPPNVVTPLMPYFALIVVFAQRYDKNAGVGTVVAMMLPYAVAVSIVWILLFLGWDLLGLPYGPG